MSRRTRFPAALFQHSAFDRAGRPTTSADIPHGRVGLSCRLEFVVAPVRVRAASESVMGPLALHRVGAQCADTGGSGASFQTESRSSRMNCR